MPNVDADTGVAPLADQSAAAGPLAAANAKVCVGCRRLLVAQSDVDAAGQQQQDCIIYTSSMYCSSCQEPDASTKAVAADTGIVVASVARTDARILPVTASSQTILSPINGDYTTAGAHADPATPLPDHGQDSALAKDRRQYPLRPPPLTTPCQDAVSAAPESPTISFRSRALSPSTYGASPANQWREPLHDITRMRVRSQTHHCLYPGSTFLGTQTNKRKEHPVSVTILDVNLASSTLCGSLTIHNLTDQIDELTTYFDAQIIGSRFGFLTQDWNSTDEQDLAHWEQFPAFRAVRGELQTPLLTMKDRDRGFIFMRWKEKFVMPDHKVEKISGASYAGFYYTCLEFGSSAHDDDDHCSSPNGLHSPPTSPWKEHEDFSLKSISGTLTGFYFHTEKDECQEYQKLALHHVPQGPVGCFEFL